MLKVVIPDPALREYGGHHPATVEALLNSTSFLNGEYSVEVYAHRACHDDYIDSIASANLSVNKYFDTDFYQDFYKSPSLHELQPYIRKLCYEYQYLLEKYNKVAKTQPIVFWIHTLNWQHAYALALALKTISKHKLVKLKLVIGVMYSPFKRLESGNADLRYNLYTKLAFRFLNAQSNVSLVASDAELASAYENILLHEVNIQPTALIGSYVNQSAEENLDVAKNSFNKQKIILFTGDAKANKGFLDLPYLANQLLSNFNKAESEIEVVVQYTLTNNQSELVNVEKQLKALDKKHASFKLLNKYLRHCELLALFDASDTIVFNYDEKIYQNQSSGVLWLAAYFNLDVVALTSCWIGREARRLGCKYELVNKMSLSSYCIQKTKHLEVGSGNIPCEKNEYFHQLYQDIGTWLIKMSKITPST